MSICNSNVYWTNEGDQISLPPHRPSSPRPSKASIYRTAFGGANGRWSIHRSRKQKMSRPRATRIQHAFKADFVANVFNCVTFTLASPFPNWDRPLKIRDLCRLGAMYIWRPQNFGDFWPPPSPSSGFHATYQYCLSAKLGNSWTPLPPPCGRHMYMVP